ncbi:MAG: hypothetical protein AAGG56_07845 [Pseudomonadota bacterium]
MKNLLTASAVVLAVSTGAAFAQGMDEGLTMLEAAAVTELNSLNIDNVDPMSLTLNQLAAIRTISGSSLSPAEKTRLVRAAINRE